MNCRVKTLFVTLMRLAIVGLVFVSSGANVWASENLTAYPRWIYNLMTQSQGWEPSLDATSDCKLTFSTGQLQPTRCESNYKLSIWDSFLSKLFVRFDVSDPERFQKIIFEPQPGLKIRALLGLQKSGGQILKKPLVILRMGIHGNIDEFLAERFLARIAYQDLGYHLLVIESLTSHGFLTLNDQHSVGGIEEGLHTFYILNKITYGQLDWSIYVSEINLMGVSLAGPGVFFTNYLDENSLVNQQRKKPSIKAIELFCPLINFEETYKELSQPGLFPAFVDLWNRRRLVALREKNPQIQNIPWMLTLLDFKPRFMPGLMNLLNESHAKPLIDLNLFPKTFQGLKLPSEFINHVEKSRSLYDLNRFWSFYKNEQTPIQVYVTPHDPAVMNHLNSDLIRQGKQPGLFRQVKFTDLKGLHCAFASEYQWPFLVELVRRGFEIN